MLILEDYAVDVAFALRKMGRGDLVINAEVDRLIEEGHREYVDPEIIALRIDVDRPEMPLGCVTEDPVQTSAMA